MTAVTEEIGVDAQPDLFEPIETQVVVRTSSQQRDGVCQVTWGQAHSQCFHIANSSLLLGSGLLHDVYDADNIDWPLAWLGEGFALLAAMPAWRFYLDRHGGSAVDNRECLAGLVRGSLNAGIQANLWSSLSEAQASEVATHAVNLFPMTLAVGHHLYSGTERARLMLHWSRAEEAVLRQLPPNKVTNSLNRLRGHIEHMADHIWGCEDETVH